MRTVHVLLALLAIACGKSEPPAATSLPAPVTEKIEPPEIVWRSDLKPCSPGACGDVKMNTGGSLQSGEVTVAKDGSVAVQMEGFRNTNTTPGINRILQIWIGEFSSEGFTGAKAIDGPVGMITTDDRGNYDGPVVRAQGPVKLPLGGGLSGVFVVIEGGGRALFLSEYMYKN